MVIINYHDSKLLSYDDLIVHRIPDVHESLFISISIVSYRNCDIFVNYPTSVDITSDRDYFCLLIAQAITK